MNGYQLLRVFFVLGGLCAVQAALADCGSSNEKNAPFHGSEVVLKFSPREVGEGSAVAASLDRANTDAPYVRIDLNPQVSELNNKPFDSSGGSVYYLEKGVQGQRICRAEQWKKREHKLIGAQVPESLHPAVRHVYPYFEVYKTHELDYDGSGQLTSIQQIDAAGRKVTTFCALYDENGRIEVANESSGLIVSDKPEFQCSQLRDMPSRVKTRYFTYRPDGLRASDVVKQATRKPGEDPYREDTGLGTEATDGAWTVGGFVNVDDAELKRIVGIRFYGSEKRGLVGVQSPSATLVPSDATPVFAERSRSVSQEVRYTFPGERVPPEVAKEYFEGVTGYTRVREYLHRSDSRIFEVFGPQAKHPSERQWRRLDLNRQENYDANGKLTRVILSGPVSGDEGYTENLRAYAEKGVLKLTPLTNGYSSYRVYDYDAAGKETLSFVCWRYEVSTNKPYAHFPWWEPDPRPKRSREAELQYGRTQVGTRCGTPDGKMIMEGMGPVKKLMETKYGFGTTKLGFPGE
ncbi:hypothetical protein [Stenotrophomonas sp. S39]|uniref:hypothetical protein n=1 Tax=Stenotrophomonas sp. S39 TaxID=2767451 RepID=UPI00190E36AA|nr:hypothetical protein [Stenotrophomonas sp. S39]MBK0053169.1 hypothetical protein [Stenotrophomonas sp. S39]